MLKNITISKIAKNSQGDMYSFIITTPDNYRVFNVEKTLGEFFVFIPQLFVL